MKIGVSILVIFLSSLSGCQPVPDSTTRFCFRNTNDGFIKRMMRSEYVDLDLGARRLYASDTSDVIELLNVEQYFGMTKPLPLIVPRSNLLAPGNAATKVNHGSMSLTFRISGPGSGNYIGQVYEKKANGRMHRVLTYRYSIKRGVYEIQADAALGVSSSQLTLRKCGGAPLFAQ